MTKEKVGASSGQKAALKRFPEATRHFNDFSLAQGYCACYNERVEPLLDLLRRVKQESHGMGMLSQERMEEIWALLKKYDG